MGNNVITIGAEYMFSMHIVVLHLLEETSYTCFSKINAFGKLDYLCTLLDGAGEGGRG